MTLPTRLLGAFALAALVVCASALGVAGLTSCGLDPASLHELADRFERERLRNEVLLEQSRSAEARVFAKAWIQRELAEGRVPLLDAAALTRDLSVAAGPEFHWDDFRRQFPDADSDEERFCRGLIEGSTYLLRWEGRTAEADRMLEKLEAELRQRKQDGTLRLPRSMPSMTTRPE
jgi:hypothetical protein